MQKSFVVKSPINFANFGFFVRTGDILVHDTANGNRLTVYRGGEIVKAITQTPLGMAALLKQGFISELTAPHPHPPAPAPPRAAEAPRKASPAPAAKKPEPEKPQPKARHHEEKKKPRPLEELDLSEDV